MVDTQLMWDPEGTSDLELPKIPKYKAPTKKSKITGYVGQPDAEGWVLRPAPPACGLNRVWHYTNGSGLIGIMESNKLWATSLISLNDDTEFAHGYQVLEAVFAEVNKSRNVAPAQKIYIQRLLEEIQDPELRANIFAFSATEKKDSLSQWSRYTGNSTGYAISISTSHEMSVFGDTNVNYSESYPQTPPTWRRVLYDFDSQRRLLLEGIAFCAMSAPPSGEIGRHQDMREHKDLLIQLIAHCKNASFSEEDEVRLFSGSHSGIVNFRETKYGISSYIEVCSAGQSSTGWTRTDTLLIATDTPIGLPVTEIMIGPNNYMDSTEAGLRYFLKHLNREQINISKTGSSVR